MRATEIKQHFPTEAALCAAFIEDMKAVGGWTVYPETAGFDILAVYDKTGHQLGIEAKLALNAKVADQITPDSAGYHFAAPGPDFRAVLVPCITEANAGIAKMLRILGVTVFKPGWAYQRGERASSEFYGHGRTHPTFISCFQGNGWPHVPYDPEARGHVGDWTSPAWFDWNPVQRCELPEFVPQVAAGVPGPPQLTQWKIGALKVLADLELDGFTTAKDIRSHGIDPRRFCATDGWLQQLGGGKWARGKLPAFDEQHPEAYAEVLSRARESRRKACA